MSMLFPISALALILLSIGAAVYSSRASKRDELMLEERARQQQFDKDKFIEDIAVLIDQYHGVIAGYGGKARTQMKREIMRNMGAMLSKNALKMLVPYLEEGMAGEDFVIDMYNQPELLQRLIDGR